MSSGPAPRVARTKQNGPADQAPAANKIVLAVAVLLVVGGLLLFIHTQTQALFQDTHDLDALNVQNPRNDVGVLLGALMCASGLTLLFAVASPLRLRDRLPPAAILTATTTLLLAAHFSIFTNGMTFPEERGLAVQSSFLFHDTAATIPMATFTLAWLTLLVLIITGLAAMSLVAPRLLRDHFTHPRTLQAQRTRLLTVTLLLLAAGSTFARQYLSFATIASPLNWVYTMMGALLIVVVLLVAVRTYRFLWGPLEHRVTKRCMRRHRNWLRLEAALWGLLLVATLLTLLSDPVYEPKAGTDPVFAISSKGLSWMLILLFGVYLLQRRITNTYPLFLGRQQRPLPSIAPDRLLAVGALTIAIWGAGALWTLHPELTPLGRLVFRLLPIIILIPVLTSRSYQQDTSGGQGASRPMMIFGWTALSLLTGIMLWGIGNSTTIIFHQSRGGLLSEPGRLLEPLSAGARLLGSLLLVAPALYALKLLVARRQESAPSALLLLTCLIFVVTLTTLFTVEPSTHHGPGLAHTDVIVGFWATSLPATTDIVIMSTLIGLTATTGLLAAFATLQKGIEDRLPQGDGPAWWDRLVQRLPGSPVSSRKRSSWKPRRSATAPAPAPRPSHRPGP